MTSRRPSYLPIASIVVGIVILAIAVGVASFRDIDRGRQQVAEVLDRQARFAIGSLGAAVRANFMAPNWDRSHLDLILEGAAADEEISHVAILDADGTIVAHSDPERVGGVWEGSGLLEAVADRRFFASRIIETDGLTVHEYVAPFPPFPRRLTAAMIRRAPHRILELEAMYGRISVLLNRRVTPGENFSLFMVIGLDSTQLDAGFLASRNHTFMMSGILLLSGGVAIYFLFLMAHYRSVRTALANMRSYTTNVIESMGSGLVSFDADARLVTVNSRARSLLSIPSGDVAGTPIDDVLAFESDADRAGVYGVMSGAADTFESEARLVAGSDTIPVALAASSLRDEAGERSGSVVLFQDMREIESLKEEVARERHLASLGRLAAGVAHEVRNPLSSLKGFAQFLRTGFTPGSREERYADIMIEEVERLDRVVQELLDFAKPITPEKKAADLNVIVEEVLSLVADDAVYRKVEITRELSDGLPHVLVDPGQIKQALLNILLNGLESMGGDGGTLTVATSAGGGSGGSVAIAVSDTGAGMTDEEVAKLYEPFYTTKPSGTGLGLTIVSRIVEQNDGHVRVASAKDEGTTFTIELPAASGRGARPAA